MEWIYIREIRSKKQTDGPATLEFNTYKIKVLKEGTKWLTINWKLDHPWWNSDLSDYFTESIGKSFNSVQRHIKQVNVREGTYKIDKSLLNLIAYNGANEVCKACRFVGSEEELTDTLDQELNAYFTQNLKNTLMSMVALLELSTESLASLNEG